MTRQTSLDGFSDGSDDPGYSNRGPRVAVTAYRMLAEDAEPDNPLSCPWCCAPPERFRTRDDGVVGCRNCDRRIPTEAEWYLNGRKIVLEGIQ